jgi:phosphate uptake regulator
MNINTELDEAHRALASATDSKDLEEVWEHLRTAFAIVGSHMRDAMYSLETLPDAVQGPMAQQVLAEFTTELESLASQVRARHKYGPAVGEELLHSAPIVPEEGE